MIVCLNCLCLFVQISCYNYELLDVLFSRLQKYQKDDDLTAARVGMGMLPFMDVCAEGASYLTQEE